MTPETKIKNAILRYLTKLKDSGVAVWWAKIHGGPMQQAGIPDLIIVYEGATVFCELKAEKGVVAKIQEFTMQEIRRAGGLAIVVRSLDELQLFFTQWRLNQ